MDDVHQLRIFQAVAQQLSFTRAAQSLRLTQSAVSHQIAALEKQVGCPLFLRAGRTITLTQPGQVLLSESQRVFTAIAEMKDAVATAARPDIGRIRIGAPATACQFILPAAVREFSESYPAWTLAITPADSPQAGQLLAESQIDLAILLCGPKSRQLTYEPLLEDELGFLVNPLHPWARAKKVDKAELARQHYVLYSRQSVTFHIVNNYLARNGSPLGQFTELGSMEAIKELVKLGLGVSLLASWIARREVEAGELVWLRPPGTRLLCTWCTAWKAGRELRAAEHTLSSLCKSSARELVVSR